MSKKTLGFIPKSGEKMLKDAIGQFKGIISQIEEGVKKVTAKVTANEKKAAKIKVENERLVAAVSEASQASENLKAMLSGKIMTEPTEEIVVEETVEKEEEAADDEEPPEDTTSKESNS